MTHEHTKDNEFKFWENYPKPLMAASVKEAIIHCLESEFISKASRDEIRIWIDMKIYKGVHHLAHGMPVRFLHRLDDEFILSLRNRGFRVVVTEDQAPDYTDVYVDFTPEHHPK